MKERVDGTSNYMCTKSAILVEDADREKAEAALEEKDIAYKSFDTPLEAFYNEEAKWRLHNSFDMSDMKPEDIDAAADEIAAQYFDNEFVLDGDILFDTAYKVGQRLAADSEEEE